MSSISKSAQNRDSFHSKWGFILACIGSAVGMGNIWLFPYRMATYGGTFLLIYLIFDVLIGFSGVVGEMSLGRAARSGPVGAFRQAAASRGKSKLGALIGGIVYLLLTGCKFILPLFMELGAWEGVINLVRVLCPACFAVIGAKFYKA